MKTIASLFLLLQFCVVGIVSASPLKPEELFPEQTYFPPKLSPNGERLLVYTENQTSGRLTIYNTKTFEVLGVLQMGQDNFAFNLYWVNNDRIVYQLLQRFTGEQYKSFTGEVFAVNYDGKNPDILFGYRAGLSGDSGLTKVKRAKKSVKATGYIEHVLPDDEDHIIISVEPFSRDGSRNASLKRLNINNGRVKSYAPTVPLDASDFYFDIAGNPTLAVGFNEHKKDSEIFQFVDGEWEKFLDIPAGSLFNPLAMHPNGQSLYVLSDGNGKADRVGLYKLNINTKDTQLVYEHDRVDLHTGILGTQGELIAVEMHDGYPSYVIIPSKSNDKKIFKQLAKNFQGNNISIVSSTKNGDKAIVQVTMDTMPDLFYLFDHKSGKSNLLFKRLDVSTKRLTYTNPISYPSFDGLQIDGYLTTKTPKKAAPMVMLVHGGPHLRDFFTFNETVQLLASQGYAVLQVNFRGSTGYGHAFESAGYKHWGDNIQKDIIAGINWAIAQGYADKNNICIMGGSFGAFSAVMSATLQPDMFKCIVANAGIYDLELLYEEGDIQRMFFGERFLDVVIGNDKEALKRQSPIHYVNKIQAPILLAHGKKDIRAPFEHAEELQDALEDANKEVTTYFKYGEAHGFENRENQIAYLEEVLKFLKKHLQ